MRIDIGHHSVTSSIECSNDRVLLLLGLTLSMWFVPRVYVEVICYMLGVSARLYASVFYVNLAALRLELQ